MNISVQKVPVQRIPETIDYVMKCRRKLFPMLDHDRLPPDLKYFKEVYLDHPLGAFFIAVVPNGSIIGTIGMKAYDRRFVNLALAHEKVSEVVKLYVDADYRCMGVGSRLFDKLKESASTEGIGSLYLHTHPFLAGAKAFWEKQGFAVLREDKNSPFQTIHMELAENCWKTEDRRPKMEVASNHE